ncbi:MAG: hypothetical protein ACOH2N_06990 [Devosia sp.]
MLEDQNSTSTPSNAMSRRAFVRGLPIAGVSMALPAIAAEMSAQDRFDHHSAELIRAISDMEWANNQRWFLAMAGRPGQFNKILDFSRFDTIPDPKIKGLKIERRVEIIGV